MDEWLCLDFFKKYGHICAYAGSNVEYIIGTINKKVVQNAVQERMRYMFSSRICVFGPEAYEILVIIIDSSINFFIFNILLILFCTLIFKYYKSRRNNGL